MTVTQKQEIISKYLSTPQGRQALAAAMVQPLRTRFGYGNDDKKFLRTIYQGLLK